MTLQISSLSSKIKVFVHIVSNHCLLNSCRLYSVPVLKDNCLYVERKQMK